MADLSSKKLIVLKGGLFFLIATICFSLILVQIPSVQNVLLLLCLVWAASRFYYFLFYVLEKYVNPQLRYAGIFALLQAIRQQRR